MMRAWGRLRFAVALGLALLTARGAAAQEAPATSPGPRQRAIRGQSGAGNEVAAARAVYLEAVELMRRGELQRAIGLFERAHTEGRFKNALWNLAECYHRSGRPAQAAQMLLRFIEHPRVRVEERGQAERFLENLRLRTARVAVDANLAGAVVQIDGREGGRAPFELIVDPGTHVLQASSPGFAPTRQQIDVKAGEKIAVRLVLKVLPARLSVASRPSGAELFIGGNPVGRTPLKLEVPAGALVVEGRLAGRRTAIRAVAATPGEHVQLDLLLPARAAQLAVSGNISAAAIYLDGVRLGEVPLAPTQVQPGRRGLRVERPGYDTYRAELAVGDAESATVTVDLRRGRLRARWFLIATAVAVTALAGAGVLWADGRDQATQYNNDRQALGAKTVAPDQVGPTNAQAHALASGSNARYDQAIGLFVVGGAAVALAAGLAVFTRWRSSDGRVVVSPAPGGLGGAF